ncbi:hypothetical protein SUDANB176_06954 [Streptomyces sp. enrichment culture]|uniref:cytochrome b N-terminal domain-containing protein n=1 Tax=Streptomyces sp. enrichment culture TaxID=1795815 RepID=UPI003F556365
MAVSEENGAVRPAARGERVAASLDKRLPLSSAGEEFLRGASPDHWSFLRGEAALHSHLVLVVPGVFPISFFRPGMTEQPHPGSYVPPQGVLTSEARASTPRIGLDVRGGLPARQVHRRGAPVFVAAIGAHLLRIFFAGAFRRPREADWTCRAAGVGRGGRHVSEEAGT